MLILIRHPQTGANVGAGKGGPLVRGWMDVPLDSTGMKDAQTTTRLIGNRNTAPPPPQAVFTSDLQRAKALGEMLAKATGAKLIVTPGLRTWNVGQYAGKPVSQVKERLSALTRSGTEAPPGGEPHGAFLRRFLHTFQQIAKQARATNAVVAIVTHASGVRAIYSLLTSGTIDPKLSDGMAKAKDPVPPGGFVVLTPSGGSWKWGHVTGEHLKTSVSASP